MFLFKSIFVSVVTFILFYATVQARPLAEILASKELRVCLATVHPSMSTATPKGCTDNCKFEGPVYEESLVFARYLGKEVKPKFLHVGWDEQFHNKQGKTVKSASYVPEGLNSGKCDLYPNNMTDNSWRRKKLDIIMLYPSRMMVMVHKSNKRKYHSMRDLAGKTATVGPSSSFQTWVEQQNRGMYADDPIKLHLDAPKVGLKAVSDRKYDFSIFDADAAIWTTRYQHPQLVPAFPVGEMDKIGWGFRKADKKLQQKVQKFFGKQRQKRNSEFNKIWKKYYGMSLTQYIGVVSVIR